MIGKQIFQVVPLTFHLINGIKDPQFSKLYKIFYQRKKNQVSPNLWIIKPGQNSNRGNGINVVSSFNQFKKYLQPCIYQGGQPKTYIVQQYLTKLNYVNGRKYDLRHFMLITSFNGKIRAYWSKDGYVRTSSFKIDFQDLDHGIHLTNDAIQKDFQEYGKYQQANKLSYRHLEKIIGGKLNLTNLLSKMKNIAIDTVKATALRLDPLKRSHNFQLFGLDFIVDQNLNPWLIEVNTNPCLQISCPLLSRIIPSLIQNVLRICVDPFFHPKLGFRDSGNGFELIFDESKKGMNILMRKQQIEQQPQQQQQYSDQGEQLQSYEYF